MPDFYSDPKADWFSSTAHLISDVDPHPILLVSVLGNGVLYLSFFPPFMIAFSEVPGIVLDRF